MGGGGGRNRARRTRRGYRPHEAELDVRLDVADAIMRFLPFGFRADLTVATWSSYPGQADSGWFRARAAPDRAEVRLDDEPSPHTDVGQRYHDLLTRYLAEGQETRLTEWLARYRTPLSFDTQAGVAVDIVQDLDLVDHVVREVRSGNGRLARVRRALAERSPAAFAADDLGVVYRFVLELPEADPATELGPYWSDSPCATVVQTAARSRCESEASVGLGLLRRRARTAAGPTATWRSWPHHPRRRTRLGRAARRVPRRRGGGRGPGELAAAARTHSAATRRAAVLRPGVPGDAARPASRRARLARRRHRGPDPGVAPGPPPRRERKRLGSA